MYEGQGHRSKVKVTKLEKLDFFQGFFVISLRFDLEVKGRLGQGQRSRGSRSDEGSKQRQVGSRQRQVASFSSNIVFYWWNSQITTTQDPIQCVLLTGEPLQQLWCASCSQQFETPWSLLQHAQNAHAQHIFSHRNTQVIKFITACSECACSTHLLS